MRETSKTERDMKDMVRKGIHMHGGLRAWCRFHDIPSAGQVSSWLGEPDRPCPPIVASALGYERVVFYAPRKAGAPHV